jgi:hypothetical protein
VSLEVMKRGKGLGVVFGATSQSEESCVAICEELAAQVFSVVLSLKSFLVAKAV